MEVVVSGDEVSVSCQEAAALGEDGVELVERLEMPVGYRLVEEGPEVFGRLQFRRVGRQVDEPDAVGDGEARLGVPAGVVEHQNDDAVASGAGLAREGGEHHLEERLVDAVGEIPHGLAGGGRDEGGDVEPLETVVAERDRTPALRRPDPALHRLQAEPVLVGGPELDRRAGMGFGLRGEGVGELFLNAA